MNPNGEAGYTIHLRHPSGSSATISRHGATVLSLQTPGTGEVLWLDPVQSKAATSFRGGIPVIFPTFGNVQDERITGKGYQQDMLRHMESVPHHGFAKDCVWDLIKTDDTKNDYDWLKIADDQTNTCHEGLSQALLRLSPLNVPADLGGSWLRESGDWEILYRVTLKEDGLALEFCVKNNNSRRDFPEDLRAKMLLHNYFLVRSPGTTHVYGLDNLHLLLDSESVRPVYSDNAVSFKVPGSVDQVWTLNNVDTVDVIVEDDIHNIITQFSIMAVNLPDLGKWEDIYFASALHLTS